MSNDTPVPGSTMTLGPVGKVVQPAIAKTAVTAKNVVIGDM